ncbi:hypothetical protein F5Y13DRAFT_47664 [Hypoxylon sp. FL1857]|nr:hypothetical protein F5Y13DRAFT_47664 [Hypoxylon sp. FL1857]
MPVTIRSADHSSRAWWDTTRITTDDQLLESSCPTEHRRSKKIIQSSFKNILNANIFTSSNGFVRAAYYAYSGHHHLTIRPEDVWFSILAQISFYVNANAEKLRSFFVAHEGQKALSVVDCATIETADFGKLAIWMTHEIEQNVVDPNLRKWIMPDFTTTTHTDTVTAAVLMMGTMQKYFSYTMALTCGIPSVTLLGEKEDWIKIRDRLDFLPQLGEEPEQFARLLRAVLGYFIRSFEQPTAPEIRSFWARIADESGGSGPYYLSGWITAFCFWTAEGECLYKPPEGPVVTNTFGHRNPGCDLDGVLFHRVNTEDIPNSFVSVPVTVDDNGKEYRTRMVAGSVGIEVTSSGEPLEPKPRRGDQIGAAETAEMTGLDSLQPVSGWWMYELAEDRRKN